ncbi:hypothetical protein [Phenylobacterium sp.]|uniref:hypothetical protein n=1 Tax=Phenylobacterium sp. TaxID=1871053 RepID=UPI002B64715A|nr:hypothetical protein [Phenylobacterium sp.]HLZ77251.1 hypothetical protein [Phenylobacterium sp.]
MDIHTPKPWRGLREFLKEYAIIVVGVLTALAAEQSVEWLHWRHLVDEGRRDLAVSYAKIEWIASERELRSPCFGARLNEIAGALDQATKTGHLPPVGDIGAPPLRLWSETEWPALVAAQTAVHFPREEARRYSAIADYLREIDSENNQEMADWVTLYTIVGPGRATGEGELSKLRSSFASALFHARDLRLEASEITDRISETHLRADEATMKATAARIAKTRDTVRTCPPMGPAPAAYNHAPLERLGLDGPLHK